MITKSFAQWLQANAAIGALTTDIRPAVLDADRADPAITYGLIADNPIQLLSGGVSSLAQATFQVDCWSQDYETVKDLAAVLRSELEPYTGNMGEGHIAEQITFESIDDVFDEASKTYGVLHTAILWHNPQGDP